MRKPTLDRGVGMKARALAGAAVALAVTVAACLSPHAADAATTGFTVRGHHILDNGQPWVPEGFTISTFQDPMLTYAPKEFATVAAQLRAIKGAWHGNVVRIQVEQYAWLNGDNGHSAQVFRDKVTAVIALAEQDGLAVVINDQSEPEDGMSSLNEPLPTSATLAFWKDLAPLYKRNPNIILDPFNEPRLLPAPNRPADGWAQWFKGSGPYISENALIKAIRADGFTNQIWAEAPGNYALTELGTTWPRYKLTDPDNNLVYTFHHTEVLQDADPSVTGFNVQFGNLVTVRGLPVVDGEWTNRSVPFGTKGIVYRPSGDIQQCWGNAPVSVPLFFSYLAARGIGITVWTLGPAPTMPKVDYINADGDNTTFTTANNYDNWRGCVTPEGGTTSGAGADLMNYFAAQSAATGLEPQS
jgi:Cellulase (glycosyl hydrolase family 5)